MDDSGDGRRNTISGCGACNARARMTQLPGAHAASSGLRLRRGRRLRLRLDEGNTMMALHARVSQRLRSYGRFTKRKKLNSNSLRFPVVSTAVNGGDKAGDVCVLWSWRAPAVAQSMHRFFTSILELSLLFFSKTSDFSCGRKKQSWMVGFYRQTFWAFGNCLGFNGLKFSGPLMCRYIIRITKLSILKLMVVIYIQKMLHDYLDKPECSYDQQNQDR